MKWLIFIVAVLALCSCEPKTDKQRKNVRYVSFDFTEMQIRIPSVYLRMTIDQFKDIVRSYELPADVIEKRLGRIETMTLTNKKVVFFVDSLDKYNTILCAESEYVRLNKTLIQQYLGRLDKSIGSMEDVGDFSRIENQYFTGRDIQLMKIKYRFNADSTESYWTQYILSSSAETIAIVVDNSTEEDFEELIKETRLP